MVNDLLDERNQQRKLDITERRSPQVTNRLERHE